MADTPRSDSAAAAATDGSTSRALTVPASVPMVGVLGASDELLRAIESAVPSTDIHARGNEITLTGPRGDVELVAELFGEMVTVIRTGQALTPEAVQRSLAMLRQQTQERPAEVLTQNILSNRGRTIRPKTLNQKRYVDAIDRHTVVFGIGPAGTGKTYLAMAKAVQALQAKQVSRIILTRPAVEAGERLGFLPGTLSEKIDPYLRPLYDALHDMIDPESIPRLITQGTIEVAPLAYMRGRAQPTVTPVLTPTGWRSMGRLRVGDLVIGADGRPTPLLGVYPQGVKKVYRITTQDGASTLACGEHLWQVKTPEDRRRGLPGRVLRTTDMEGRLRRAHLRRYELPVVGPVHMEPRPVPLDPYALGLLLGDGCITLTTTPGFSTRDPELAQALEAAIPDVELVPHGLGDYTLRHTRGGRGGVIVTHPVSALLREIGLAGTDSGLKYVPTTYLFNSADVRLGVLQGLLDTDGGPVTQAGRTCRVQYTTCSDRLRDDVIYLVRSLGGVAYTRTRRAAGRKPGGTPDRPIYHRQDAHIVDIRLPAGVAPFRLERKRTIYDARGGGRPMRMIDSIVPAGETECVCIAVGAPDSLYVTEDFIVTHNTLNDAFIILDEAQNTSPEQMKMFLTRLGFGSQMVVTGDITQVDLPGGVQSGLRIVRDILTDIQDLTFIELTAADVVRHRLVGEIVDAYGRWDAEQHTRRPDRPGAGGRGSGDRGSGSHKGRR